MGRRPTERPAKPAGRASLAIARRSSSRVTPPPQPMGLRLSSRYLLSASGGAGRWGSAFVLERAYAACLCGCKDGWTLPRCWRSCLAIHFYWGTEKAGSQTCRGWQLPAVSQLCVCASVPLVAGTHLASPASSSRPNVRAPQLTSTECCWVHAALCSLPGTPLTKLHAPAPLLLLPCARLSLSAVRLGMVRALRQQPLAPPPTGLSKLPLAQLPMAPSQQQGLRRRRMEARARAVPPHTGPGLRARRAGRARTEGKHMAPLAHRRAATEQARRCGRGLCMAGLGL